MPVITGTLNGIPVVDGELVFLHCDPTIVDDTGDDDGDADNDTDVACAESAIPGGEGTADDDADDAVGPPCPVLQLCATVADLDTMCTDASQNVDACSYTFGCPTLQFTLDGEDVGPAIPAPDHANDLHVRFKNGTISSAHWTRNGKRAPARSSTRRTVAC